MKLSRPFRPHDAIVSHDPGRCPGLRDNAPLALKEGPDYSLGFSISSKARMSIAKTGSTILHGEPNCKVLEKRNRAFVLDPDFPVSLSLMPKMYSLNLAVGGLSWRWLR